MLYQDWIERERETGNEKICEEVYCERLHGEKDHIVIIGIDRTESNVLV